MWPTKSAIGFLFHLFEEVGGALFRCGRKKEGYYLDVRIGSDHVRDSVTGGRRGADVMAQTQTLFTHK